MELTANSESEINNLINQSYIDIAIISSYFDFDDYDDPIHYYLQDMNMYNFIPNLGIQVQYQVRLNQAVINDDIFLGSQGISSEVSFYNIERKRISYSNIDFNNAYLQVYINLDPQVDQYQRTVYSFLDMLGFIGGIFELLKTFGYLLVCYFIKRAYYSSIISKLYHVEANQTIQKYNEQIDKASAIWDNSQKNIVESPQRNKVAPRPFQTKSSVSTSRNNNLKEESKYVTNFVYVENVKT